MVMQLFTVNDIEPNLEERYKAATEAAASTGGVVLIYKADSPNAAANTLHKAHCGFVVHKSKLDGVTNKIVASSLLEGTVAASRFGVRYKLCGICFKKELKGNQDERM
ncbi:hypothetical protein [Herbiconiux daphne]|uniref:Uncharacterized protein n=1 Tax=Herbiconiux daphne TaxID=2970914 RepID=A0ABT2HBB9_9MICO|nr:hypothetical protein [Herbiconiux daphne]MCS5737227.1 hypothetical protein [Herbiconiux daphne]